MLKRLAAVLSMLAWLGCVHTPPHPLPTPTPGPTPTPVVSSPLHAEADGTWTRGGVRWIMRMCTVCCKGYPDDDPRDLAKSQNWALTSVEFLQWITFHKQNATEVRPLMCPQHEGAFLSPYEVATPDLRVNLSAWNPAFWAYLDNLILEADRHGAVVMVSVIDTWPVDHGLSPWCEACNTGGANYCNADVLKGKPPKLGLDFARKVYEETARHSNVIYQDGNESFEDMSADWTLALRDLLRTVETERGYVRHPFGTQQRDSAIRSQVDFVTAEQDEPSAKFCSGGSCKPTIVNESSLRTPADVLRRVYRADELGTSFAFWMGDLNQDQRGQTLIALEGWANGQPIPPWAAPAATCPNVTRIDAHVHLNVCNNQVSSVPCAGGSTVVDSTPRFNGKECNDEHDNCSGRICEPPDGPQWLLHEVPGGVRCFVQNPGHCDDGRCPSGPRCSSDHGYQLKCENQRSGHYKVQPFLRNARDCEGSGLKPPEVFGEVVEWDVP